jgi:hypothetical protein
MDLDCERGGDLLLTVMRGRDSALQDYRIDGAGPGCPRR